MAKKGSFSKVYDKNGDYVDVEAARFDGTRTFQMQGDVSATQTWNGDSASALTLNTSIGAKKVTTDKINDKAVQTGQIDDGAVGLTQISTNAMNGTVQDNDSKLATHAAVKTYVDAQISGQGTYLGKHTVAEINAMVTDNLHNGDRVMTSDSGTINLGPGGVGFDVEAGEDLILYKSGSTVQWDSMDGNFKTKQTAVSDPTASGTGLTFIDSASQDENGEMTLSKKTVQDGTTSQKGVVQLEDSHSSTSTTKAATPNSVKEAYDLASTANSSLANKQDKPSSATENNIATFNGSKSTKDSGKAFLLSTSTWDGTSDDKVPSAKAVQARLDLKADLNKVVAIADAVVKKNGTDAGWYKVAEKAFNVASSTAGGTWAVTIISASNNTSRHFTMDFNVRSQASGQNGIVRMFATSAVISTAGNTFRIVLNGTSGAMTIELWYYASDRYGSMMLSEISTGGSVSSNTKYGWTYYNVSESTQGSSTAPTGAVVKDLDINKAQTAVANATSGNFAGLDANGLLTDSGNKAADFELVANKVTSVRDESSATDTAYPSEKAVATALADKVDVPPSASVYGFKFVKDLNTVIYNGHGFEFTEFYGGSSKNYMIGFRLPAATAETPMVSGTMITIVAELNADYNPGLTFKYKVSGSNLEVYALFSVANRVIYDVTTVLKGYDFTVLTSAPDTSGLTDFPDANLRWRRTPLIPSSSGGVGSSSVPIYIDDNNLVKACTDDFEHTTNKVSSWQTTPDNTHYPSEKLVKDGLDAKADANKVVAIADAFVLRRGQVGQGWYKLAETTTPRANYNINAVFDVVLSSNGGEYHGSFVMSVRYEGTGVVNVFTKSLFSDNWFLDYPIKIVHTKVSSTVLKVELYFGVKPSVTTNAVYSGISISEQNAGNYGGTNEKNTWTYTSYTDVSGSAAPESDTTSDKEVVDVDIVARQHNIASPTENNLVAMDANGLVKDSGLAKSSVESAITSAGSAIQGVKVNNTTLTPDANKVVTVPLATTSADGAMSAADKTKLNNAVTKKTGFAYKGTAGGDVFKIAEKAYSKTFSHSEQFVFHVAYGRHSTNAATSELNVLLAINKDSASSVTVFKNTILSKQGFSSLDWTFKASVDDTNGLFTLYAVRTAGQYTTVEATCIAANSEKNNLIDNVVVFENTTAELPETAFTETTLFSATSSSSSGTAPVKVDAYGALTPVPMDSTPTASSTNLMTSGDIKTALDGKDFLYVNYRVGKDADTLPVQNQFSVDELNSTSTHTPVSGLFFHVYTVKGHDDGSVTQIAVGVNDTAQSVYIRRKASGSWTDWVSLRDAKYTEKIGTTSSHPAIGSTAIPVYVNSNGEIKACTDDFVHDADIAKMVQVETAGTAAGSSLQPVYVDTNGVAKAGIYTSWESARGTDNWINALSIGWYRSSGNFQTTKGTTPQYIRFFGLEQQGIVDFWVDQFGPNKPMAMHFTVDFTSSGPGTIVIKERTGYDRDNIESLVVYKEKRGTSVRGLIIKIVNSQGYTFSWRSTGNITSSNCEKLTDTEYTTFIADYNIISTAIPPDRGGFSSTARNKQRGNNILDTGDVTSTYSSTGTEPVNGTAVAAALATSLTDVEYVANASGGGGNLNKTKNGSTSSVLAFMTTAEAHSLWTNAKTNAS